MWPLPIWRHLPNANQSEHRWGKISGLSQGSKKKMCKLGTGRKLVGDFPVWFWHRFAHLSLWCYWCVGVGHKGKVTLTDRHPVHGCSIHLMWPTWRIAEGHPRETAEYPSSPFLGWNLGPGCWGETICYVKNNCEIIQHPIFLHYASLTTAQCWEVASGTKAWFCMPLWVPCPIPVASMPSLNSSSAAPKPPTRL